MSDHRRVYERDATGYEALVSAEDVDKNLPAALSDLVPLHGRRAVEVGAGTGRVTRLLEAAGSAVVATEPARAMATTARKLVEPTTPICRAEAAHLPFGDASFDLAIAGWVFAHQREWEPARWRDTVATFVDECQRVIRPGSPIVLIETLGTGTETPAPPSDLIEYYEWLERQLGFERTWIRTDYQFKSVEAAATITGNFFGPGFADEVKANGWDRVPECTGIWVR